MYRGHEHHRWATVASVSLTGRSHHHPVWQRHDHLELSVARDQRLAILIHMRLMVGVLMMLVMGVAPVMLMVVIVIRTGETCRQYESNAS